MPTEQREGDEQAVRGKEEHPAVTRDFCIHCQQHRADQACDTSGPLNCLYVHHLILVEPHLGFEEKTHRRAAHGERNFTGLDHQFFAFFAQIPENPLIQVGCCAPL